MSSAEDYKIVKSSLVFIAGSGSQDTTSPPFHIIFSSLSSLGVCVSMGIGSVLRYGLSCIFKLVMRSPIVVLVRAEC